MPTQVELSGAELKLLQSLMFQECGVYYDESCIPFLQERVRGRLRAKAIDTFYNYYRLLTSSEGKQELSALLENVTLRESGFFNNKPQLDLFQKVILEELLRRKHTRRDWTLRAWSAGCSTGQEAFTMAIQIADALAYYYLSNPLPQEASRVKPLVPPPWRVEIMASDMSYSALQTAQAGVYLEKHMAGVEYTHRLRYFDKMGERYAVRQSLKSLVQFDLHNLKTEFLPQHNDVIFCRNAMMRLEEAEKSRLIDKLYRCLNTGGYLFVGQSESLFGLTDKFRMIHQDNGTAYQRIEKTI
ncbi:MAG TPA: CheR family methyltransferase [Terriglobia bacterium]|nr:CheR family methyltransferase [Terriglobia bacterium]